MLALLPRRGLHRWEAVTRVSLTRGAGRGAAGTARSWEDGLIRCCASRWLRCSPLLPSPPLPLRADVRAAQPRRKRSAVLLPPLLRMSDTAEAPTQIPPPFPAPSLSFPLCLLLLSSALSDDAAPPLPSPAPRARVTLTHARWGLRHCTWRWLPGCCSGVKEPNRGRIRPILPSSPHTVPTGSGGIRSQPRGWWSPPGTHT